jgi:hypothetical protein
MFIQLVDFRDIQNAWLCSFFLVDIFTPDIHFILKYFNTSVLCKFLYPFLMKSQFVYSFFFCNTFYNSIHQMRICIMCLQSSNCSLRVKCFWIFVNLKIFLIEWSQVCYEEIRVYLKLIKQYLKISDSGF